MATKKYKASFMRIIDDMVIEIVDLLWNLDRYEMYEEKMKQYILSNYNPNKNKPSFRYFLSQAIQGIVFVLVWIFIFNFLWFHWFSNFILILLSIAMIIVTCIWTIKKSKKKIRTWILIENFRNMPYLRGNSCAGSSSFGALIASLLAPRVSESVIILLFSMSAIFLILFFISGITEYCYKCYLIAKHFPKLK